MTFVDRIKRTLAFFSPENLRDIPLTVDKIPGDTALLVIDVQKEFCDPRKKRGNQETDRIAKRIQSVIPAFRKASIPTYVIYFKGDNDVLAKLGRIDFHHFTPDPADMLIAKNRDSAFQGSPIGDILKRHNRTKILTCGFNLNACVYETVIDACKNGFEVSVLEDLVGNDNRNGSAYTPKYVRNMKNLGVMFSSSDEALRAVRSANAANQTPRAHP